MQKETRLNLITERCEYHEPHRVALYLRGKRIIYSPVKTHSFEKTKDRTGLGEGDRAEKKECAKSNRELSLFLKRNLQAGLCRSFPDRKTCQGYLDRPGVGREVFQILILSSDMALATHACRNKHFS